MYFFRESDEPSVNPYLYINYTSIHRHHPSRTSQISRISTIQLHCTKSCSQCRQLLQPLRLPRRPISHKWEAMLGAAEVEEEANPKSHRTTRISNNTTAVRRIPPCRRCRITRHHHHPVTITTRTRTIRTTTPSPIAWVSFHDFIPKIFIFHTHNPPPKFVC